MFQNQKIAKRAFNAPTCEYLYNSQYVKVDDTTSFEFDEIRNDGLHPEQPVYVHHSDVYMLLNVDRMQNILSVENIKTWIEDCNKKLLTPVNNPTKGLSDDDLLLFCRDRSIQSASEMKDYIYHLAKVSDDVKSRAQRTYRNALDKIEKDKKDSSKSTE